MSRATVLLIDDDAMLLRSNELLLRVKYDVRVAESVAQAKGIISNSSIDVAVVDLNFEGQESDGLNFIDWMNDGHADTPVIVLSGDHCTSRVVEAMRRRSLVDFVAKSKNFMPCLEFAITKGLTMRNDLTSSRADEAFFTKSPLVKKILGQVDQVVANSKDCSILVTGPSGAGKEFLAQYIAEKSRLPLIAANMASIPRETAESELFGHKKGAFTGAHADKTGLITTAHGGIFFLDEIGECSPEIQAKLLRVVEEKEVTPVGSTQSHKVNVRFIAATNRNLDDMVQQGTFRLDLLNRLNTISFELPGLKFRPQDIEAYTVRFVKDLEQKNSIAIKPSGIEALLEHSWPGNVRELRNVISRFAILSSRRVLDREGIVPFISPAGATRHSPADARNDEMRTETLIALNRANGNRSRAATLLGINPSSLFRRINKLGIGDVIAGQSGRPTRGEAS